MANKRIGFSKKFLCCLMLSFLSAVNAVEIAKSFIKEGDTDKIKRTLKLGLELSSYYYRERESNHAHIMSMSGSMWPGLSLEYILSENSYFASFDIRILSGHSKYNGFLLKDVDKSNAYYTTHNNSLLETRLLFGTSKDIQIIGIYSGFGYRKKADWPDYRVSQYLYIPLGVSLTLEYHKFSAVPFFEYDIFLFGKQTGDYSNSQGNLIMRQKRGYGLKTGISFQMKQFEIAPYLHYWNIKASTVDRGWYEPDNATNELGIRFSYLF